MTDKPASPKASSAEEKKSSSSPPPQPPSIPEQDLLSYEEKLLTQREIQFAKMKAIGDWTAYAQSWFCDLPEYGHRLMLGFAEDRIPAPLAVHKGLWNTLLMNSFIPIEITLSDNPVPWHDSTPKKLVRKVSFITGLFPKLLYPQLEYLFHLNHNQRYQMFTTTPQYPIPDYPTIRAQFLMESYSEPFHRVARYFPSLSHYGKTVGHFLERVNPQFLNTVNQAMVIVHILDRKWNHGADVFLTLATTLTSRVAMEPSIVKMLKSEEEEYEREDLCSEIILLNPKTHTHKSLGQKSPREIRLIYTTEKFAAKQRETEIAIWKQMQKSKRSTKKEEKKQENKLSSSTYDDDHEDMGITPRPKPSSAEWVPHITFPPIDAPKGSPAPKPPTPPPRPPTPPSPPSHTLKTEHNSVVDL